MIFSRCFAYANFAKIKTPRKFPNLQYKYILTKLSETRAAVDGTPSQVPATPMTQYLPHHMTYATAKFEVATSNGLGGYAFPRKYIIGP